MKNKFKFIGMMLLAGALTLASCGKEEAKPDNNGTEQSGQGGDQGGTQGGDTTATVTYTLTVAANNDAYGTVDGGGQYEEGATATLTATPNSGYAFEKWNDGNTENPRTVTVSGDATYTAIFASTAAAGASVTVGDVQWDAAYISGAIAPTGFNMFIGKTDGSHMPLANIYCIWEEGASAVGNHHGAPAITPNGDQYSISFGNPRVWYFNRGQVNFQTNGGGMAYTGDYWAKDVNVNITDFDAASGHLTATVSGTLAYVKDTIFIVDTNSTLTSLKQVDFDHTLTYPFSITLTNVALTPQTKQAKQPAEVRVRR